MARSTAKVAQALDEHDAVRHPPTEKLLDAWKIKWDLVRHIPTSHFDHSTSLTNQARFDPINPERVKQYRADLRDGAVFPAVVATQETRSGQTTTYYITDGNHRLRAHSEEGQAVAAYVLAEDTDPTLVVQLTFVLNKTHGLALSDEEKLSHAAQLHGMNYSIKDACQMMGIQNPNRLETYLNLMRADRRRRTAGVPDQTWKAIRSETAKIRLAAVKTNKGLAALAELVVDAGINGGDVSKLVREVNEHFGTAEQVEYIRDLRDQYLPDGKPLVNRAGQNTGRGMGIRMQVGNAMSVAAKVAENPAEIASKYIGPEREKMAQRIRDSMKAWSELVDLLETKSVEAGK